MGVATGAGLGGQGPSLSGSRGGQGGQAKGGPAPPGREGWLEMWPLLKRGRSPLMGGQKKILLASLANTFLPSLPFKNVYAPMSAA